MEARDVAARMTTFMVLLYAVYMGALLIGGLGLYTGVIPGGGSFAMTSSPRSSAARHRARRERQLVAPATARPRRCSRRSATACATHAA